VSVVVAGPGFKSISLFIFSKAIIFSPKSKSKSLKSNSYFGDKGASLPRSRQ
jgi:hypothetical protein